MTMTMTATVNRRTFLGTMGLGSAALAVTLLDGRPASAAYAVTMTAAQWKARLGPQRFAVLRQEATERPYSSPLNKEHRRGIFVCAGCNQALFSSATKFDSGTGWPSFWKALPNATATKRDSMFGMTRIEEHCSRCGGHLGHIFDDGPPPTGKRHCINGLSLAFRPA